MLASDDVTAMHLAALRGDLDVLRKHAPLHANVATPEGYTALSLAASAGMIDACRLLLREGATVDAADNSGVTRSLHSCMHACTGTLRLSTCSVITCNYMKQFRLIEKHR